jgi:hypothetical protein
MNLKGLICKPNKIEILFTKDSTKVYVYLEKESLILLTAHRFSNNENKR